MLDQRGWGGRSSRTELRSGMDLADFLAQEGLFQTGGSALWSTFDPTPTAASTSVPEPASVVGLLGLGLLGLASRKKKSHYH